MNLEILKLFVAMIAFAFIMYTSMTLDGLFFIEIIVSGLIICCIMLVRLSSVVRKSNYKKEIIV